MEITSCKNILSFISVVLGQPGGTRVNHFSRADQPQCGGIFLKCNLCIFQQLHLKMAISCLEPSAVTWTSCASKKGLLGNPRDHCPCCLKIYLPWLKNDRHLGRKHGVPMTDLVLLNRHRKTCILKKKTWSLEN